ncbi:MAG: DUF5106 domain-containing protein [Chitinophagales bacterium]|nr:DUF5106 domain-containing protein [Chitinophagales bacterium]
MKKFLLATSVCFLIIFKAVLGGNEKNNISKSKISTNIKITVKGLENSNMILAFYSGDKQYVKDTLQFDSKGVTYIKADTPLPGGIYLAVFPKLGNRYFEIIMSENSFHMETDTHELAAHMKVYNSLENKLFYDDILYLNQVRKLIDSLNTELKKYENTPKGEAIKEEIKKIEKEARNKRESIITNYPQTFYAKVLKSMKEPEVPETPRDATGKITDSTFQWYWYKTHYWDNFDLNDDRMLRTPVFHNRLKQYFTKTVYQIPDSLSAAADGLLKRVKPQSDIFKYMLVYFLNSMANSKIMGMDAVYVHLVKNYYAKGYATWVDSAQLAKIVERGTILEPLLIGKKAQNIVLADTTLRKFYSLNSLPNKYTIVCFWDPDCGHCKKEVPILFEAYTNLKKKGIDVEVFAAAIMGKEKMDEWTKFIREKGLTWINVADPYRQSNFRYEWDVQSTPQIYILDKNKIIKAKRVGAEQVEDFILYLEDPNHKPKKPFMEDEDQKTAEPKD